MLSLAEIEPFNGIQVLAIGFAAFVFILLPLISIRKGTVPMGFGIQANVNENPKIYWLYVAGQIVATLLFIGFFCISLWYWTG